MKKFNFKSIRTNLKKFRKDVGMNQKEFWEQFRVTQSGGSRYENGRKMPKPLVALVRLQYPNAR